MKNVLREVHKRSLWQVLGIYLGASWLILQVVDTLAGALSLPDWSASFALFLLIVGLPIVLTTAFIQGGVAKRQGAEPPADDAVADAAATVPTEPDSGARPGGRHLFTWKNAILGGVGAFALLGVLGAGWLGSRTLGIGPAATLQARGVIDDQALVVLADFESVDPEIAAAATEALRVDLSQSGAIRLADRSLVSDALQRMERDPDEALTSDIAKELARREGAGAVIQGQISQAGDGYVFTAQLVSTQDGATLTSQRETAASGADVISAIEDLSRGLRERIGESLGSIREAESLARVTTANLEALELYSKGSRLPNGFEALTLYEQAVELDPEFAMAWNSIAVILGNRMTERARALDARTRAFELRDRLTRRERHLTSAFYYYDVVGDLERTALEYEAMLELDPNDLSATNNIGMIHSEMRDHERAERHYRDFIALTPDEYAPGYWNLVQTQIHLGKWDDAWATIDTVARRFPGGRAQYLRTLVASNQGDFDRALSVFDEMFDGAAPDAFARGRGDRSAIYGALGRLAEARAEADIASRITRPSQPAEFWEDAIQRAWLDILVVGRADSALAVLDEAEADVPFASLAVLDRPYAELAEILARAGEPGRARALLSEADSAIAPEFKSVVARDLAQAEGAVALAEGRVDEAVSAFRRSDTGMCEICPLPGLAAAYEAAGLPDSAIAVYTRYVETPFPDRYASYAYALGPAIGPTLERLGQLNEEQGNLQAASRFHAQFVELWEDADPELQPRVAAAQARLEAILREIG
jgi:tetratricopeptide (TPR) repeat protein